jgi:hypothetical protein
MLQTCYLCDPQKVNDSDPLPCNSCKHAAVKALESELTRLEETEERSKRKLRWIRSKLQQTHSRLKRLKTGKE